MFLEAGRLQEDSRGLDDDPDASRLQGLCDGGGDLLGETLLDWETDTHTQSVTLRLTESPD